MTKIALYIMNSIQLHSRVKLTELNNARFCIRLLEYLQNSACVTEDVNLDLHFFVINAICVNNEK